MSYAGVDYDDRWYRDKAEEALSEARAEIARLKARQDAVIHRIHTGDATEGWGSRAAMEIYEELTGGPYPV